jgi:hypothetical protein
MNRYVIAELVQSDAVIATVRREFRRLFPSVKITDDDLKIMLANEVLKRDTIDGDAPKAAKATIRKAVAAIAKKAAKSM